MTTKKGWKSPDPAKKRRKAKAKKHAAPKAERPDRKGVTVELRSHTRTMSLLANKEAEIVYPVFALRHIPGVVLGGRRSDGRVTTEAKDSELWGVRADRKTDAKKYARNKRKNSVKFKRKRSEAREAGTYDPSSVGKPSAFSRKRDNPDVTVWRNPDEVPAKKFPERIRIGRRGTVVVIPATRKSVKDQVAPVKVHRTDDEHSIAKAIRLGTAWAKSHKLVEYDEPTGKYTAQYILKKERQIVGYKKILVEEIWKEINGKRRLVGKVHEKGEPIWGTVVVEERVENFRPKTQRKVKVVKTAPTVYAQDAAVKISRVNPDRLIKREIKKDDRKFERANSVERRRIKIDARKRKTPEQIAARLERKNAATADMKAAA